MVPLVKHPKPWLSPNVQAPFTCPVLGKAVRWEAQQVYNPAAVALSAAETPGNAAGSGEVFARATAELHRAVQEGRIAGAAHLVVRDGKTLYSAAAGVGDIEKKTPLAADAILRIYSMTKPITSVAALMLFERGQFGLDDPVARFIPAFTNATVLEQVDAESRQVPPRRPITVRDVLRHTTGYSCGDEAVVKAFYEREGLRYWGPNELFPPKMSIARAAEALARVPALHHPGEKFTYGFDTDLLGRQTRSLSAAIPRGDISPAWWAWTAAGWPPTAGTAGCFGGSRSRPNARAPSIHSTTPRPRRPPWMPSAWTPTYSSVQK